ncbi:MAG: pentapeptide repeat-containing protein [Acidobacteria bacterium]|nr:pentapeptide repeat-containing protein [Acidobacteriota bacterium]
MVDFLINTLLKPFFAERMRVLKYFSQRATAEALLTSSSPSLLKKGLSLLFELAISYPYKRQEVVNQVTEFLRTKFPQDSPVSGPDKDVLESGLRSLAALPRLDQNGYPFNFDIHQIRVQDLNLTRTNFRYFSLWGCRFHNVILSHSSFEDADLGGAVFDNCSLEYANLKSAKLCASFMDHNRPARFTATRLWGANLQEANIACCELQNFDNLDLGPVQQQIAQGCLRLL